jgi:hypothetical protein
MSGRDVFRPAPAQKLRSVFAPVHTATFNSTQFEACREFLTLRSAETEAIPIVDEQQLLLSADGSVAETGYRFNAIGFSAVANTLVSGLNSVFNELAGETRYRFAASSANGDLTAAISIYNMVMRARFESLRERTLLINHKDKTIEGFLGLDHRLLDNAVFLNLVSEEAANKQTAAEFYRAEIVGRELRIYYADMKTKRNDLYIDPRHTFAGGWYFSNREDTGLAIRAAMCLLTKFGAALDYGKKRAHVRHTGSDLVGRAALLISKTLEQNTDMDAVARNLQRLVSTSLGFSPSKTVLDSAMNHWISYLIRFKVPKEEARQICKNAAAVGSDLDARDPVQIYTKEIMASRNLYDLFCSMLRYSRGQYHTTRDLLQGVAMDVLLSNK